MRTAVEEFNKLESSPRWPLPRSLDFDQAKNPEADIWLRSEFMGSISPVPITIKRKAIDLYNLIDRAQEEVTLLQSEMKNVMDHFSSQHATFSALLVDPTSDSISAETKGRDVYLRMKLMSLETHLVELKGLFENHIDEITLPEFLFDREVVPSNNYVETEEVNSTILSLPERDEISVSDVDSDDEYETDFENDADSAFFSIGEM